NDRRRCRRHPRLRHRRCLEALQRPKIHGPHQTRKLLISRRVHREVALSSSAHSSARVAARFRSLPVPSQSGVSLMKFVRVFLYSLLVCFLSFVASSPFARADEKDKSKDKPEEKWDTTLARGKTRNIDFDTTEGTWMSVDISPDGKWIVFD